MKNAKKEKSVRKRKKPVLNLVKKVVYETGLSVKAQRAKKVAGLIVMLQMERVVINPAAAQRARKDLSIQHAAQLREHAKKKAEVNPGAKNLKEEKDNE